ncbi:erythronate-4-phosphate dehydrogenase [Moraxella caviae]|uniref:Erythronate-4-phosphate dehydrogenase n=2 Tax=Moraxella caviae TaxID=34060 RepID=A0A1S9ZUF0_9GAMM|nr:erythronate-4-phosphate dehydrogenase [Moraxella caviae]STZ13810.1 Erythronate-4-phosphate dehydrogenase [Moraxella caviae]VEW10613.1 Erythronate-4-phosphate dehydrogenase [Moraxella caviae]
MISVLADENISNLGDYLRCHQDVRFITIKGRDINQQSLDKYRPDALFIRSVTPIKPSLDLAGVKFVGSATIGTDHVDAQFLAEQNIRFANAVGCSKHSVAQYVLTAIGKLRPNAALSPVRLGIIGLGNIGSTLAGYAKDLGWQVAGYDPFLPASAINNSDLPTLLQTSDVISLHTPLTRTGEYPTFGLMNREHLAQLKPNALLINSARGEIIKEADLIAAIDEQNLQVVLDVFPHEPVVSAKLCERLSLATPHIAGYTTEGKLRGTDMIYRAFCEHFGLPVLQNMDNLLAPSPYQWQDIKRHWQAAAKSGAPDALTPFYDIGADDASLRAVCTAGLADGEQAAAFDRLRKEYPLRREWLY